MADIQVILEVLGAKDMEKAGRVTQTLENKINSLAKQLERGRITNQQYQTGVQQLIRKNTQHAGSYKVLQKDVQRYSGALQRSVNDKKRAEAAVESLTQDVQRNTSTTRQAAAAHDNMSSSIVRSTKSTVQQANATQRATKSTKQFASIGLQQVGYQFSDFIVQTQSGTSAMVAFGQQGSQLAGLLFLLKGNIALAAGVIASIGIPLFTAFGNVLLNLGDGSDELKDSIDRLKDSFNQYDQAIKNSNMSMNELSAEFKSASEQAERFFQIQSRFARLEMVTSIQNAQRELSNLFTDVGDLTEDQARNFVALENVINRIKQDQFDERGVSTLSAEELNRISQLEDINRDAERAVRDLRGEFKDLSDRELSNLLGDFVAFKNADALSDKIEEANDLADSLTAAAAADGKISEAERERIRLLNESIETMLRVKAAQDGSVESAEGLNSELSSIYKKAYDFLNVATKWLPEVSPVEAKMNEINQVISDTTGINLAGVFQRANNWASTLLETTNRINFTMFEGSAGAEALRKYGSRGGNSNRDPIFGDTGRSIYNQPTTRSSGGGSTQTKTVEEHRQAVDKLIASYDEAQKIANQMYRAETILNDAVAAGAISLQKKDNVLAQYRESLRETTSFAEKMGKTLSDSLGGALMSVVDGTKSAADAFKDMARQILKKAYELLVIQPIMDSITGALGGFGGGGSKGLSLPSAILSSINADGNAFQNGNQLTAYANGGVVNSPTLFPMANGAGLMGEAGPEAIMPLKRGKNGKLGVQTERASEAPVNVYQTININGNGDEYIMGKIQQAAPQIANFTQRQMMDQRRRGGAVKSTFG